MAPPSLNTSKDLSRKTSTLRNTRDLTSWDDRLAHGERIGKDRGEGSGEPCALPSRTLTPPCLKSQVSSRHQSAPQTHEKASEKPLTTACLFHHLPCLPPALPPRALLTDFLSGGGSSLAKQKNWTWGVQKTGLLSWVCHQPVVLPWSFHSNSAFAFAERCTDVVSFDLHSTELSARALVIARKRGALGAGPLGLSVTKPN